MGAEFWRVKGGGRPFVEDVVWYVWDNGVLVGGFEYSPGMF